MAENNKEEEEWKPKIKDLGWGEDVGDKYIRMFEVASLEEVRSRIKRGRSIFVSMPCGVCEFDLLVAKDLMEKRYYIDDIVISEDYNTIGDYKQFFVNADEMIVYNCAHFL